MLEYKDDYKNALIINRLNGGRITTNTGSLAEGVEIHIARSSVYDKDYPQRWNIQKVGEKANYHVVRIEQSDNNGNTFCLDAGTDKPQADQSVVMLKKADGSDRQKWLLWVDFAAESILHQLAPLVDGSLVMTAQGNFGGAWDRVVLSRTLSSVDRLWYFNEGAGN